MEDLTKEIMAELRIVLGMGYPWAELSQVTKYKSFQKEFYLHHAIYWLTGVVPPLEQSALHRLYHEYRDALTSQQRDLIALNLICLEIDSITHSKGEGLSQIKAERARQLYKGFSVARDLQSYKGDDLRQFSIHRLTSDLKYYPFISSRWTNLNSDHTDFENIVQAGAILLAHIQMTVARPKISKVAVLPSGKKLPVKKELLNE